MKPTVSVLPGQEKIIGYKINDRKANIRFNMVSAFKEGANNLVQEAKTKGLRYDRLKNGLNVGINAYILHHKGGILYFYENTSNEYVLKEQLTFELLNARLEATPGQNVTIDLRPQQTYILNAQIADPSNPHSIKISACKFNVESQNEYPTA